MIYGVAKAPIYVRPLTDYERTVLKSGLRSGVKVIVGGEPITPHLAAEIGADGYAPTAREAVALAWRLIHA